MVIDHDSWPSGSAKIVGLTFDRFLEPFAASSGVGLRDCWATSRAVVFAPIRNAILEGDYGHGWIQFGSRTHTQHITNSAKKMEKGICDIQLLQQQQIFIHQKILPTES